MMDADGGGSLSGVRTVHLVGVAGSGLQGLARLFLSRGIEVSGSELQESVTLEKLRREGIRCSALQSAENIRSGVDLVVISAAVGEENPELASARARKIPVLKYAQCLGKLMAERRGVAVAGTHGKTTTTAMVASILEGAGRDPGFLIGGEYPGLGGGSRWGQGEHFVAEACEFDRSFLNLHPAHAIVTNIEEDHLDYFRSLDEIQEAFAEFAGHLPAQGTLVLNADCPHSVLLARRSRAAVSRFSLQAGSGDWWAEEVQPRGGGIEFLARSASGQGARIALAVPGIHNVRNGLAAIALLSRLGLSLERIAGGLERFSGVRRRFEVLLREPVTVIDDYAHHPTEIEAVLRAARETFAGRPIRLVFQPHQHSRMRRFLADFAAVLAPAEEVVVAEVFRARDSLEEVSQVKAAALVAEVQRLGGRALHLPTFSEILDHLRGSLLPGEVVICLGAGDITVLAKRIAEGPLLRGPLRERCPA